MISEIRSYIKSQILGVDNKLIENKSAFYDGDIGESLIDRSYQIEINNIVNTLRDSHREYSIDVQVSIFGFGYNNQIVNYDNLLDKALCINDNIIEIGNFSFVNNIVDIQSNGISSENLAGNDNGFKIDINLQVNIAYNRWGKNGFM